MRVLLRRGRVCARCLVEPEERDLNVFGCRVDLESSTVHHLAEATLAQVWGRRPTDAEVAPYWRTVVEANRRRLVDPANPDLIRPGQVFTLPPTPAPP